MREPRYMRCFGVAQCTHQVYSVPMRRARRNPKSALLAELHRHGRGPDVLVKRYGVTPDTARRAWGGDRDAMNDLLGAGWNPFVVVFMEMNPDKPPRGKLQMARRITAALEW